MNYRLSEADYAAIQASSAQHVPENLIYRVRKQQSDAVIAAGERDARHDAILALRGVDIDSLHRKKRKKK